MDAHGVPFAQQAVDLGVCDTQPRDAFANLSAQRKPLFLLCRKLPHRLAVSCVAREVRGLRDGRDSPGVLPGLACSHLYSLCTQ